MKELGKQLAQDFHDRHPVMIGVLRGVFYFMADLTRNMPIPLDIEFMAVSYFSDQENAAHIVRRALAVDAQRERLAHRAGGVLERDVLGFEIVGVNDDGRRAKRADRLPARRPPGAWCPCRYRLPGSGP